MQTQTPQEDILSDPGATGRRDFLKTAGGAAGLAAATLLLGPATLRRVEAATQKNAGLDPLQAAQDEDFWREIQQAFTVSSSVINLNNGTVGCCPRVVTESVVRYIWQQEEAPPLQKGYLRSRMESVRVGLATLFGSDPEETAIVRNTTEAMQNVLFGIDMKPGDEVLTTTQDFYSMVNALEQRRRREGISVKKIDLPIPPQSMDEIVTAFERGITAKTRLILLSHPITGTGQYLPVKPICDMAHQRGIEVIVDGAHSFAQIDFKHKDLDCDYYGTSLHKWLFAPKGTGMLYVRRNKINKVWPLLSAPEGMDDNIRKFEGRGTISYAPYLGISEALSFHNGIGPKRKEERLRYLTNYWARRLQPLPKFRLYTPLDPEMCCAIASFGLEGIDAGALSKYLQDKHRILTAGWSDRMRITPSVYTTLGELDYFCSVIEDVAENGLPQ